MRIVDRATFLAMPEGVVFQKYEPQVVSDLGIKLETVGDDFFLIPLDVGFLKNAHNDTQLHDMYHEMERGEAHPLDFETSERDGCFDRDQLFAVWGYDDVKALVNALTATLPAHDD